MSLKNNISDREMQKFELTNDDQHAIRIIPFGTLDVPNQSDYIQVAYPNSLTETYTYRDGGLSGTVLKIITVVYLADDKNDLASVSWT